MTFEIAPQYSHGCDWSAPGKVLARKGKAQLIYRPGCKFFASIGYRKYAPPEITIVFDGSHAGNKSIEVTDNFRQKLDGKPIERLCKSTILAHKELIDSTFGEGAAERISALKGTIYFD